MTTTAPTQATAQPPGETLDTLVKDLCNAHGLSAVGKSLAQAYGRTKAMQAVLGYQQEADC
ncbi:MAG: hypothetical protein AAGG53_15785 [Cyanobacteria bacterium P01_H01_bin.152]